MQSTDKEQASFIFVFSLSLFLSLYICRTVAGFLTMVITTRYAEARSPFGREVPVFLHLFMAKTL